MERNDEKGKAQQKENYQEENRETTQGERTVNPTFVELVQDTNEWKRWRAGGIGSSAAPTIMFENQYQTPFQLFQKYMDLSLKTPENRYMARGKKLEATVRELYAKKSGNVLAPACFQHQVFPYLRCSADGVAPKEAPQMVCEIKCPDEIATHLTAREGQVPRQYWGQCQHLLMVTGAEALDYVSFYHGELIIVPVEPDEAYTDALLVAEHNFWRMVTEGRWQDPEKIVDMSQDEAWVAQAQRFIEYDRMFEHAKQLRDTEAAKLAQMCGMNKRAFGAGVEASWTHTVRAAETKPRGPVNSWSLRVKQVPAERVD